MVHRLMTINPALELQGLGFRSVFVVGGGELAPNDGTHTGIMLYAFEAGWPTQSLSAEWRFVDSGTLGMTRTLHGGWETPFTDLPSSKITFVSLGLPFALPLRPLWPGFAINALFYAAILWLAFAAPFALRRRLRIKRGLCPRCAYDLHGSAPGSSNCPECGEPLRLNAPSPQPSPSPARCDSSDRGPAKERANAAMSGDARLENQ